MGFARPSWWGGFVLLSLGLLVGLSFPSARSWAENEDERGEGERIVVVVSPENPIEELAIADLRRIYLRQLLKWPNGWTITPYDLRSTHPIREAFSRAVLGKKPEELSEYWLDLRLTRGLRPPKVCGSVRLVKAYLARVRGGIGYIPEDDLDATVKRIEVPDLD